jgi:hypothetical protein
MITPSPHFYGIQSVAFAATLPLSIFRNPRVLLGVFVPLFAVRVSARASIGKVSSQDIFSKGNGLKVLWVHAPSVSTEVVENRPIWDGSIRKHKSHSVCPVVFISDAKLSVTSSIKRCRPKPARIRLLDLLPKALFNIFHAGLFNISTAGGQV